ncbi:MAG: hypothetical protein V1809_10035 [Planctomycetota bacterium]
MNTQTTWLTFAVTLALGAGCLYLAIAGGSRWFYLFGPVFLVATAIDIVVLLRRKKS